MAFGDTINARFKLSTNGTTWTDVTQYLTGVDPTFTANLVEIKVLGSQWVQQLYGHRIASFTNAGLFAPELDGLLWDSFNQGSVLHWRWHPQGEGSGKVYYQGQALIPEYKPGVAGADAEVKESFQLKSDGQIVRTIEA